MTWFQLLFDIKPFFVLQNQFEKTTIQSEYLGRDAPTAHLYFNFCVVHCKLYRKCKCKSSVQEYKFDD